MKASGWFVLLAALMSPGCLDPAFWNLEKHQEKGPPVKEAPPLPPAPPPVTAEQVSDANAPEMLNRLRDELDREANERVEPPAVSVHRVGPPR